MKPAKLEVELENVVRNYDFDDKNPFLFCIFETISNALYCSSNSRNINIDVKFAREYKTNELVKDDDNVITSVSVTDNGIGFTDENFNKFTKKLYESNHEGGKGYGRIAYLKVFNDIFIESTFIENTNHYSRNFKFDLNEIEDNKKGVEDATKSKTTIYLKNIKPEFRDDAKFTAEYYAEQILHHFYIHLHYLLEKDIKFEIKIYNENGNLSEHIINSKKLNNDIVKQESFEIIDPESFENINSISFDVLHIKTNNIKGNKAFYIVDERSAGEIKKLNIPFGKLEDINGVSFSYYIYLKSPFFGKFLNDSRTKLSLPTETKNKNKTYFTEEKIIEKLQESVNGFLKYELSILEKKIEEKISNTLTDDKHNKISNNKSYLYMLADDDIKKELLQKIKFADTEREVLNKTKTFHEELQAKTIEQINITVEKLKNDRKTKNADIDFKNIEDQLQTLLQKINIENTINLTSYIMYRKYVLDLFSEGLNYYKESKEYNEAFFHNLLMLKHSESTIDSNLWMLDDLFLYFEGASEVSITDIKIKGEKIIRDLNEEESKMINEFNKRRMERRIDLLFFPEERQCIIIELKDPKTDMDSGIVQMDRYAKQLANFIKQEYSIDKFYTYLITDNFNKYDTPVNGFKKIYGIDGYVRPSVDITSFDNQETIANQYSEVIRYTDIYERAKKRNNIYLKKLNV